MSQRTPESRQAERTLQGLRRSGDPVPLRAEHLILLWEALEEYPDLPALDLEDLSGSLQRLREHLGAPSPDALLIDWIYHREWDPGWLLPD